jgi:hypothetical protein
MFVTLMAQTTLILLLKYIQRLLAVAQAMLLHQRLLFQQMVQQLSLIKTHQFILKKISHLLQQPVLPTTLSVF